MNLCCLNTGLSNILSRRQSCHFLCRRRVVENCMCVSKGGVFKSAEV